MVIQDVGSSLVIPLEQRENKFIATDTYFANEKSIESYHCAQVFFGMISKMLYVAGMYTDILLV
jgi:hypothetical protein